MAIACNVANICRGPAGNGQMRATYSGLSASWLIAVDIVDGIHVC